MSAAQLMGPHRPRPPGTRPTRHPVRHHHQRLAHLPEVTADQCVQSLLGVHVPRRYGLQPRLDEPDEVPPADGRFDVDGFEHAWRLWTIVLEISVMMAQFPSRRIAEQSYDTARSAWAMPISAGC